MNIFKEFLIDLSDAWRAGEIRRDPIWYLVNGYITTNECLLLEQSKGTS